MDVEQMALLIPIFTIVFGVGVAVVAIVAGHSEKMKRAELRHREQWWRIEQYHVEVRLGVLKDLLHSCRPEELGRVRRESTARDHRQVRHGRLMHGILERTLADDNLG